jgi:23S rRNA (adenine2030-N6)-methyltransferase
MGYKHFGKIGDIWKHLPLCDIVKIEDFSTYVETNSAYFDYKIENSPEQEYGIGLFIKKSERIEELKKSTYYRLIKPYYDKNRYLGSCGQKYIFFDLDPEAIKSINDSVADLGLSNKVETKLMDSVTGFINLLPLLNTKTFVHIDPYLIGQPNENGDSHIDGFIKASAMGIKCFLWYGFSTIREKNEVNNLINSKIKSLSTTKLTCDELILNEIQEDVIKINPGILGCGILTSNLSQESVKILKDYASLLVKIYNDSRFNGKSGALYHASIINRQVV